MYRIIDNSDGSILFICFTASMANRVLSTFSYEKLIDGTIRFVWEECTHVNQVAQVLNKIAESY